MHKLSAAICKGQLTLAGRLEGVYSTQQVWAAWGIDLAAAAAGQSAPALLPTVANAQRWDSGKLGECRSSSSMGKSSSVNISGGGSGGSNLAYLAAAAPACPQLCLFSEGDVLIPPAEVRAFAAAQVTICSNARHFITQNIGPCSRRSMCSSRNLTPCAAAPVLPYRRLFRANLV